MVQRQKNFSYISIYFMPRQPDLGILTNAQIKRYDTIYSTGTRICSKDTHLTTAVNRMINKEVM